MRTGEFDSRQCLRTSGQYQQAEEDFWRAVWSGNSKEVAIMVWHGWRRVMVTSTLVGFLPTKSSRLPNQSGSALPANLLLVLSGRQDNARLQREKRCAIIR